MYNSFGIQAYWGGLAVKVVLSSIFPSFQHMANTLPTSAAITTNELVGFIIYIIIFTPLMLVHPRKYHKFLWWAFGASVATMAGLFIWAVAANGGASVLGPKKSISSSLVSPLDLLSRFEWNLTHLIVNVASACCKLSAP
jgi:NCS1 family nucleobase:cation symporter-1